MSNDSDIFEGLVSALVIGESQMAVEEAVKLKNIGISVKSIVTEGIEVAMARMNSKCTLEDFNLLEIMLVGRASMAVMKELMPVGVPPNFSKGTVLLATMEGDIHDLGKNIVKIVLTSKGYYVVDCGKDCPTSRLISKAKMESVDVFGVSGLITSVIPSIKGLRASIVAARINKPVIIAGGAALHNATPNDLDVDYIARDVFDGANFIDSLRG